MKIAFYGAPKITTNNKYKDNKITYVSGDILEPTKIVSDITNEYDVSVIVNEDNNKTELEEALLQSNPTEIMDTIKSIWGEVSIMYYVENLIGG